MSCKRGKAMNKEKVNMTSQSIYMIQQGFKVAFPIAIGYIPIAITYGVLAKQSGLSLIELTLMSAFVYAGASQFMGVNMIVASATAVEIILATFVLNFRHFVMSLSFMNGLREHVSLKGKMALSLGLTDETFSVAALHMDEAKKERSVLFYGTIILTAYLTWVFGSLLGGLVGNIIPETLSQSMGIALYALFIALLVPSVKKHYRYGIIAIIAIIINVFVSQFLSSGWAIVMATVFGGLSGLFILKEEDK